MSSTFTDLEKHRAAAISAILGQGFAPVAMEYDVAKPSDVIESSLQMVRDASAYLAVIGQRYGSTPVDVERNPHNVALTELEFNEAVRLGRPILLFIMGKDHLLRTRDAPPSLGS
jgi:hypothetical protein